MSAALSSVEDLAHPFGRLGTVNFFETHIGA